MNGLKIESTDPGRRCGGDQPQQECWCGLSPPDEVTSWRKVRKPASSCARPQGLTLEREQLNICSLLESSSSVTCHPASCGMHKHGAGCGWRVWWLVVDCSGLTVVACYGMVLSTCALCPPAASESFFDRWKIPLVLSYI